jgi:hypothetical protein
MFAPPGAWAVERLSFSRRARTRPGSGSSRTLSGGKRRRGLVCKSRSNPGRPTPERRRQHGLSANRLERTAVQTRRHQRSLRRRGKHRAAGRRCNKQLTTRIRAMDVAGAPQGGHGAPSAGFPRRTQGKSCTQLGHRPDFNAPLCIGASLAPLWSKHSHNDIGARKGKA